MVSSWRLRKPSFSNFLRRLVRVTGLRSPRSRWSSQKRFSWLSRVLIMRRVWASPKRVMP